MTDNTAKESFRLPMHLSSRCTAHSKRTGNSCKSPAVKGWTVWRMHGAKSGVPSGKANGRFVHGSRTIQHKAAMALIRFCSRAAKVC